MARTGAARAKTRRCLRMRFLSRPACIRNDTRPNAAGACGGHTGSHHDGDEDDELDAGLRGGGGGAQSHAVSCGRDTARAADLVHQQHEHEAQDQRHADAGVELLVAVLVFPDGAQGRVRFPLRLGHLRGADLAVVVMGIWKRRRERTGKEAETGAVKKKRKKKTAKCSETITTGPSLRETEQRVDTDQTCPPDGSLRKSRCHRAVLHSS
ncbi:hypothetical protein EYF80_025644 [Liparis tanakae]|uniref:Uncharacterized protein n=1 Tax=Liparis tanakae TaxID=230148 RepID=A0A4Z2HEK6_9TELE|nr:hypothetical protein EYF80_025644 [Liparis tanakae]